MALSQRFFSDVFRDMQRAFSLLEHPNFFDAARRSLVASNLNNNNNNWNSLLRYPATDMVETPESFELQAELPGYDKKDIQIELADSRTLGSSETAVSKETNTPQWWVNERVTGSFQRSFSFPVPIKADGIKANYENGVLKVTVPKSSEESKKLIEID
ncbi:HSP20-like chaperone [Rhizopus microsporus ATCC 52813]|uniref:HSP20-like chaperone n=1 Tax=Rhizopus microsporus ATCC 52813 TaxID=1340429 RepID=A0A2G4SZK6_RHIZD|nr:HSP20-like chaperone [Rhizopus microsporus ATCC 52813]PHZ14205.1 HSP20-like chaperone [Rhizopus microsporus ATCC 52813]